ERRVCGTVFSTGVGGGLRRGQPEPRRGPPGAVSRWYHRGMAMTLRLHDDDERLLAALAEAEGVSQHEARLRAIRCAAGRTAHREQVRRASADNRQRYADLLDRLGRGPTTSTSRTSWPWSTISAWGPYATSASSTLPPIAPRRGSSDRSPT